MSERFATTQWSLMLAGRDGTEGEAQQALESLLVAPRLLRLELLVRF